MRYFIIMHELTGKIVPPRLWRRKETAEKWLTKHCEGERYYSEGTMKIVPNTERLRKDYLIIEIRISTT